MSHWDQYSNWEEAEADWDLQAKRASEERPLKVLKSFPKMEGITRDTAQGLKWKSFYWMVAKDKGFSILKSVLKKPFVHAFRYLKSLFSSSSFRREGDFFYYGIQNEEQFRALLKRDDTLLLLGFSYCHKPFECPSGRFSDQCIKDLSNPVCRQCFIGKASHAAPKQRVIPVYIPTVHDIGRKVFELIQHHPDRQIVFLITACEMTLTMFADWGNLAGIVGVGVRLDGRICNTMRAFKLSEEGIKPGLTVVLDETQKKMLEWLKITSLTLPERGSI